MKELTKLWLFDESMLKHRDYMAGERVEIQIMRAGKRNHPSYGEITITTNDLDMFKKNFDENKRGVELAVDENHEKNHRALGRFRELIVKSGNAMTATIELTKLGAELLSKGAYRYFSPEFYRMYKDEENGEVIKNLLVGGAFTNRPFFKFMSSLAASEEMGSNEQENKPAFLYMFNSIESMNEITNILAAFHETGKISADDQAKLKQLYSEVKSEDRQPQFIAQVETALEYAEEKADEEEEDKADDEADDDKKEEDKGQEHSEEEDDEDDEEDEDEEEDDEPKKATEEMVSISATELEQLRIVASEKIKSDVIKKVRSFSFSEKNKSGGIMPKAKNTAVEFALSLNEDQRKAFYAFLKKNQFDTSLFSELGTSKEDETKNMSEEEALNYKVQKYATENKLDYDVALRQYTEMEAQKEDTK